MAAPKSIAIRSAADLVGKRTAARRGTTNDTGVTWLAPPGIDIVRFEDEATNMTTVVSGQVDVIACHEADHAHHPAQSPRELEVKLPLQNSLLSACARGRTHDG